MTNAEMLSRPGFEILSTRGAEDQADHYDDSVGLHPYTFNQVEGLEQWRQRMLGTKEVSGTGAPR